MNVNWEVLRTAGQMESVEVFYNFMIMDANMNVFLHDPSKVTAAQTARMKAVWGDDSWPKAGYQSAPGLFGDIEEKSSNETVAEAFRDRLKTVAGFKYVPDPMPMRNSKGAVVYYLFFASQNKTGAKIVKQIFGKYRNKGAADGQQIANRMDRGDVESRHGLRQSQPRLCALLRGADGKAAAGDGAAQLRARLRAHAAGADARSCPFDGSGPGASSSIR